LLDVLRNTPELTGCKCVAVTGYDDVTRVPGTLGFDGHLKKPVDLAILVGLVQEISEAPQSDVKPATA